jgi:hypothetical protein
MGRSLKKKKSGDSAMEMLLNPYSFFKRAHNKTTADKKLCLASK